MRRALVTVGLALWMVASSLGAQRRSVEAPDVLLIGSSSIHGAFGRVFEDGLREAGMRPRRIGHSSSGFSRPDFFDWVGEIPRLGDLHTLRGVVWYIGGNDAQAIRLRESEIPRPEGALRRWRPRPTEEWIIWRNEAAWRERYRQRVTEFVGALCTAGARRAVVVLPAAGENAHWHERMERVRGLQAEGTRAAPCGVVVDPSRVRFPRRSTADGVHLTLAGSRVLWREVGAELIRALTP